MQSGADSGGVSVRIVFRGHAGQCTGCGAGADSLRQYLRDEFLRAIQYGSYLQRSMGRTVPDRWDCSSGLVPGCAAASMAGGEDFACRGDTVPVTHQFQGDCEPPEPLLKGDRKGSPLLYNESACQACV